MSDFRAYHKVKGIIVPVISINFESMTARLFCEEPMEENKKVKKLHSTNGDVSLKHLIIMERIGTASECEHCNSEFEFFEFDVVKIQYLDYITAETKEEYGIVILDKLNGTFIDFPQYGTVIQLNDEIIETLIHLGCCFDDEVCENITDKVLVEIINDWRGEEEKETEAKILKFVSKEAK